jgi:hypothetical protein
VLLSSLRFRVVPQSTEAKNQNYDHACRIHNKKVKKKMSLVILPDGQLGLQITTEQPHPQDKTKFVTVKEFRKLDEKFLKILHQLPQGCLHYECVRKLLVYYPQVAWTCSNCSNVEKLLKLGFYPSIIPFCENCENEECIKRTPLEKMRTVLFKKCKLLER